MKNKSSSSCVIYSFGVNRESSFEAEFLRRTDSCQVWGYDASVNEMGPQIPPQHSTRAHFNKIYIKAKDQDGVSNTLATLMKKVSDLYNPTHLTLNWPFSLEWSWVDRFFKDGHWRRWVGSDGWNPVLFSRIPSLCSTSSWDSWGSKWLPVSSRV